MRSLLFLVLFLFSTLEASAADLGATVRLNSQKTGSSPLPILVMVRTSTSSIESGLNINIASGWSIDSSVAVTTTGLPTGITPLPSIGTGIGSGQNISFVIGDLVSGVDYGFYITAGVGLNPGVGIKTWVISTNSDTKSIGIPVIESDNVAISGRVGASATDFQIGIVSDKTSYLSESEEVTYQITYGSYLLNSTKPLVIVGQWSRGTVAGSPSPSVDIVDYVLGSGSSGFGGVEPVIDLINRKITWTINSFPANTVNQTVSFKLQINNSYTGSSNVDFDVSGVLSGANVVTIDSILNQTFRPTVQPTITPTPATTVSTSTSSTTSTSAVTVTPTVTPKVAMRINKIRMAGVTDSSARIEVVTNIKPESLRIVFGKTASQLNKSIVSLNKLLTDWINLEELSGETDYYFRVQARSDTGEVVVSDIYTFRTALDSVAPEIDLNSVIVSVANNIVVDTLRSGQQIRSVILLPNLSYALRVSLTKSETIKTAKIFVRDTQVLGINTVYGAEPNSATVDLMEIKNGGFLGHLVSPHLLGYYEVVVQAEDSLGNIIEEKVGQLRVVEPLVVRDASGRPVENARVTISRYNEKKQVYETISTDFLGMKNPGYTEPSGKLLINFLEGKYEVEIASIGYQTKTARFELGWGGTEVLPIVVMDKAGFSWSTLANYYRSITINLWQYSGKYLENLMSSGRFFELVGVALIIMTGVIGGVSVMDKYNLSWWMLPIFGISRLKRWGASKDKNRISGKVVDAKTKKPISGATIYLIDAKKNKVLGKSSSDLFGEFELATFGDRSYKVAVKRDGYETTNIMDYTYSGLVSEDLYLEMENIISRSEALEIRIGWWLTKWWSFAITAVLLILLLLELGFVSSMGVWAAGPWLIESGVLLWWWLNL